MERGFTLLRTTYDIVQAPADHVDLVSKGVDDCDLVVDKASFNLAMKEVSFHLGIDEASFDLDVGESSAIHVIAYCWSGVGKGTLNVMVRLSLLNLKASWASFGPERLLNAIPSVSVETSQTAPTCCQ